MLSSGQATLATVVLVLGLVRVYELVLDRVHEHRLRRIGGTRIERDGLGWIVLGQVVLFAGLATEGFLLRPIVGVPAWGVALLVLAALALAVRHWCILSLGDRWTIHVVVLPSAPLVHRGPYRWFRHPNYAAVIVEAVALPAAFGLWWTLGGVLVMLGPALLYRIRRENKALFGAPEPRHDQTVPRQTT